MSTVEPAPDFILARELIYEFVGYLIVEPSFGEIYRESVEDHEPFTSPYCGLSRGGIRVAMQEAAKRRAFRVWCDLYADLCDQMTMEEHGYCNAATVAYHRAIVAAGIDPSDPENNGAALAVLRGVLGMDGPPPERLVEAGRQRVEWIRGLVEDAAEKVRRREDLN